MFEILTPLAKLHRISRQVDPSTFSAYPGIWGKLNADGTLSNVTEPSAITKLIVGKLSSNPYESHDVRGSGRITTIEDLGFRFTCDHDCFTGDPSVGDFLAVSDKDAGKLFSIDIPPNGEVGDYELVARVEEKYSDDTIVCRTVSPAIDTAGAPVAPVIDLQPVSQDLEVGDTLDLSVHATGTPPLHYAWTKGGNPVGSDSATFQKLNVQLSDDDDYQCTVSNTVGNDISDVAVITVTQVIFHVTYDGNESTGGSVPVDSTDYEDGDTVTVLDPGSLVRTGYEFDHWNTQSDDGGTSYNPDETFDIDNADVTLYAIWIVDAPVPLVGNGGMDMNNQE
jgi:hypothetical protein